MRPRPRERGSERCGPRAHQAPRAGPETQNRGAHHWRTGGETRPTHALGRRSALGARTPRPPRRCAWSFGVTAKETSRGRTHPDGAAGRRLRSRLGSEADGAGGGKGRGRACSGDRARPVAGGSAGHGAGHGARGAKVLIAAESAPEPGSADTLCRARLSARRHLCMTCVFDYVLTAKTSENADKQRNLKSRTASTPTPSAAA